MLGPRPRGDRSVAAQCAEIDPGDLRAMTELRDAALRRGRWQEVVDVLGSLRSSSTARRSGSPCCCGSPSCSRTLAAPDRAVPVFEAGARARSDPRPRPRRWRARTKAKRWSQLGDLLLERARHAANDAERTERLVAVARMYEDDAADPASAFLAVADRGAEGSRAGGRARAAAARRQPRQLGRASASSKSSPDRSKARAAGPRPSCGPGSRATPGRSWGTSIVRSRRRTARSASIKRLEALELHGTLLRSRQSWGELVGCCSATWP